jgi:hypothetical protein
MVKRPVLRGVGGGGVGIPFFGKDVSQYVLIIFNFTSVKFLKANLFSFLLKKTEARLILKVFFYFAYWPQSAFLAALTLKVYTNIFIEYLILCLTLFYTYCILNTTFTDFVFKIGGTVTCKFSQSQK